MQIVRTLTWIVVTIILVAFVAMNWGKAPVNFWPLEDTYLHFEWPIGFIALVFFILGMVPMWLMLRATRWRLNRRIQALENSLRAAAAVAPPSLAESRAETAVLPEGAAAADVTGGDSRDVS